MSLTTNADLIDISYHLKKKKTETDKHQSEAFSRAEEQVRKPWWWYDTPRGMHCKITGMQAVHKQRKTGCKSDGRQCISPKSPLWHRRCFSSTAPRQWWSQTGRGFRVRPFHLQNGVCNSLYNLPWFFTHCEHKLTQLINVLNHQSS